MFSQICCTQFCLWFCSCYVSGISRACHFYSELFFVSFLLCWTKLAVSQILSKHYSHRVLVCLYDCDGNRKNCKMWASVIHKCQHSWLACQLKTRSVASLTFFTSCVLLTIFSSFSSVNGITVQFITVFIDLCCCCRHVSSYFFAEICVLKCFGLVGCC